jgi:hypothetical protein
MTAKTTTRSFVLNTKQLTFIVLILLAMLSLTAIAVYSQISSGKIVANGFVTSATFATNGELNPGYRGGVGPTWHRGPRTYVANPPVVEVSQPIILASPQANPELSIARRHVTDGSEK